MIFVTVGTDGPFDRLVQAVDLWAGQAGRTDVLAQIGRSTLRPRHLEYVSVLQPHEFRRHFEQASIVVSHAGMGTILSALRFCKPILIMPRRASLGEQRNEHQLATARRLQALGKVAVAADEGELLKKLGRLDELTAAEPISAYAQPQLTSAIAAYIRGQESNRA